MNVRRSASLLLSFVVICLLSGCAQHQEMMGVGESKQQNATNKSSNNPQKLYEKDLLAANKGFAKDVLPLYIDTAKVFSQLSISALALTIVFKEKVLGKLGPMKVSRLLMASWVSFLISIGAGILYQWLAIRLIAVKNEYEGIYFPLNYGLVWPGNVFGMMLIAFFTGSILLVITSVMQLLSVDDAFKEADLSQ